MRDNGKFMAAKFKSICPETGNSITKGTEIFYSFLTRKAYSQYSETYKKEKQKVQDKREFIQDPGEIAQDKFWYNNY